MPSQYVAPMPRAELLAKSQRDVESICGVQPPSRVAGGVMETHRVNMRCQPPMQGYWQSHGDAPARLWRPAPRRVTGRVTETRRVASNLFPKTN
jgi:hypothetical protein